MCAEKGEGEVDRCDGAEGRGGILQEMSRWHGREKVAVLESVTYWLAFLVVCDKRPLPFLASRGTSMA